MIKAVLLDLDDTLIHTDTDAFFERYLQELGAYCAHVAPPEKFIPQLMDSFRTTLRTDDPSRPLYARLMEQFASDGGFDRASLDPLFERFYEEQYCVLAPRVSARPASRALLDWLAKQDLAVVVATNPGLPYAAIRQRMVWGEVSLDFPFALVTSLEEMHFGKPRPEYYAEIVHRLGVESHEALMVGDDWENDIVGASAAGLAVYWVTDGQAAVPDPAVRLDGYGTYDEFVSKATDGWLDGLEAQATDRHAVLYRLAAYPAAVNALRDAHDADVLECRPEPGEWSARDIVCHLRDQDADVRRRLGRVLAEDNPFLSANTDPWAYGPDYDKVTFDEAFSQFVAERQRTVRWLTTVPADVWARPARDAIFGPTHFAEVVRFHAEHDRSHLQQMDDAITHGVEVCG